MKTSSANSLFRAMTPGHVYRRAELAQFSKAVDRDLQKLTKEAVVRQPAAGLYYRPKTSTWGELPAEASELVRAFLKTDDFLLTSLDAFNPLGVGLTQLSNVHVVYNRKRVGEFVLDGMKYQFKRPHNYPTKLTKEYLYVDLLNNWDNLLEPPDDLEKRVQKKLKELSPKKLQRLAHSYGKVSAQRMLQELTADAT